MQARETVLSIGEEFFQSHGVIAFHQRLGEELEKNNNFRVFIRNFEVAYQGGTKFLVSQGTVHDTKLLKERTACMDDFAQHSLQLLLEVMIFFLMVPVLKNLWQFFQLTVPSFAVISRLTISMV